MLKTLLDLCILTSLITEKKLVVYRYFSSWLSEEDISLMTKCCLLVLFCYVTFARLQFE